jgi:hypothetical protein
MFPGQCPIDSSTDKGRLEGEKQKHCELTLVKATGIRLLAVSCIRKKLSSYRCSSKLYTQIQYFLHKEHSLNYRNQTLKNLYKKRKTIYYEKTIQNMSDLQMNQQTRCSN